MLVIGLAVRALRVGLLWAALVVEDRVSGLLIGMRGVFDERVLGLLEALGLSPAALDDRTLCGVELLVAGNAADAGGLGRSGLGLLALKARIGTHRAPLSPWPPADAREAPDRAARSSARVRLRSRGRSRSWVLA
jgi:hypothetical protein